MDIKRIEYVDEVKDVQEADRTIVHIITNENPDRMGDVVRASGMNDEGYSKNPVVMFGHDYNSLPIGKSLWRKRTERGGVKGILAKTQFADTPEGHTAFTLWRDGFLNAASIGFLGKESEVLKDESGKYLGREFKKWELLEYSIVPVPANAGALRLSIEKGELPQGLTKALEPFLLTQRICELEECKRGMETIPEAIERITKTLEELMQVVKGLPVPEAVTLPDYSAQFEAIKREIESLKTPPTKTLAISMDDLNKVVRGEIRRRMGKVD